MTWVSLGLLLAMTAGPAYAQATPPVGSVYIQSLQYSGAGCPQQSVNGDVALDGSAFTILFGAFTAMVGPGAPPNDGEKDCRIIMKLALPPGWSYAVTTLDLRGLVKLDNKVMATERSTWYFEQSRRNHSPHIKYNGPIDRDYVERGIADPNDGPGGSKAEYNRCGENPNLIIDTNVKVDAHGSPRNNPFGIMTVDSADGQVKHTYHVIWKKCP
jgi:hypothetical protein